MAVYEVFSQPELRRYKTHICSKATLIQFFCILLTFIPPLLIAYRSHGFWQRLSNYEEQPSVFFKHKVLTIIELADGNYVTWSTYQNFNQLQMDHVRVPLIKSREEDINRDGVNDVLHFQLDMPLLDSEQVIGVKLILVFDYRLYTYSTFQMEGMTYIEHSSPVAGASLQVVGDLKLQQREPLGHRGLDNRYNTPVIDETSIYADAFELPKIFQSYSERNVSASLSQTYPVWITGRGTGRPFIIKTTIQYPKENVLFTPGFWNLIKWGWVQYVAILLIFLFLFDRIKRFIFQNQLVTTVVERPWAKEKLR